jgi:hypothetical protein
MIRPPNHTPHPMPYPAHRSIRPMIRPLNASPHRLCGDCAHFQQNGQTGSCTKPPGVVTHADAGACWHFAPTGIRHGQLCPDCLHFLVHNRSLRCGAYPGADAPAYLTPCPNFTPRSNTPQPSGD